MTVVVLSVCIRKCKISIEPHCGNRLLFLKGKVFRGLWAIYILYFCVYLHLVSPR